MPIEISPHSTLITGDSINFYRLLSLRGGLKLEMKGLRLSRGSTCYAVIKREFGLKGSKQKVYEQFCKIVDEASKQQVRVQHERLEGQDAELVPANGDGDGTEG